MHFHSVHIQRDIRRGYIPYKLSYMWDTCICVIFARKMFLIKTKIVFMCTQHTQNAPPKDAAYVKREKNTVKFCVNMNNLINCFSSHKEKIAEMKMNI